MQVVCCLIHDKNYNRGKFSKIVWEKKDVGEVSSSIIIVDFECFEEFRGEVIATGCFFYKSLSYASVKEIILNCDNLFVHGFCFCFWFFCFIFPFRHLSHILLLINNSMISVASEHI